MQYVVLSFLTGVWVRVLNSIIASIPMSQDRLMNRKPCIDIAILVHTFYFCLLPGATQIMC